MSVLSSGIARNFNYTNAEYIKKQIKNAGTGKKRALKF